MSVFAVGPALAIDGPLPVAPPHGLLTIPGVLVEGEGRWMNGVNVFGYPTDTPETWEPCSSGTFRTKSDAMEQLTPRFDPFGFYQPYVCTTASLGPDDEKRASIGLQATQSFAVEEGISQGVALSTNPFFGDANVTVLGGGAVTPEVGLRYLEEAIGGTARMGMIHATPAVVVAWDNGLDFDGSVLRTANGTPVVSGGGYIGATADGAAAAAGQSWAFATGPVEVRLSEMQLVGDVDTSNNDAIYRAEKYALATWDTALQVAVLVDWTP